MKVHVIAEKDFLKVLEQHPRITDRTKKAAKLVLVSGYSQTRAASLMGMNNVQLLNRRIKDLFTTYQRLRPCPEGWREVKLQVPPMLENELDDFEEKISEARIKFDIESV